MFPLRVTLKNEHWTSQSHYNFLGISRLGDSISLVSGKVFYICGSL